MPKILLNRTIKRASPPAPWRAVAFVLVCLGGTCAFAQEEQDEAKPVAAPRGEQVSPANGGDVAAPEGEAPELAQEERQDAEQPNEEQGNAAESPAPGTTVAQPGEGAIQRMEDISGDLAPSEGEAAGLQTTYVPPVDQVTEYLRAIDQTEAYTNAYSTELADLYLGLGQSLMETREYEKAKQAFQQGMQIVRVNYGLNSPEQSNYMYAIANIESELGNRKAVDEVMDNIYLINARNYGEKSPEMIPVLDRMLSWYMGHRPLEDENSRFADMERAELLAGKKAEIVEETLGLDDRETTRVYRQVGQINWQTARYVLSQGMSIERGLVVAVGSPPQNPNARAISVKELMNNGEAAFAKVAASVNKDESRSPLEKAEAISQLGDWNLAFGRRRTAGNYYEQAHRLLADDPKFGHYADQYFGVPTPVRFMQEQLVPVEPGTMKTDKSLAVSMTVTEGGRPLDVEIIDPPESFPPDHVRLMKRMVSDMRFRPRLVAGRPEKIENFIWHLPMEDPEWFP